MKKLYSLTLGLLMAATGMSLSAATGNLYITFDGTDNVGWNADGMTVASGVMHVDMPVSGDKARADLKFSDPSNPITFNAETDKYLAIKFVGTRPAGNMTLEFKANGVWYNDKSNNKSWVNSPNGTIGLRGGNTIYYYDLTKDETYMATVGNIGVSDCNIKIADCTKEPYEYTIDWMGTFASVDDIHAWAYTADEGVDDCEVPVVNQTTGVGYENIQPAISAAANNDVLMVNSEVTFTSRTIVDDKSLTFKARTPGVVIKRDFNNNQQFTFGSEKNNRSFTFEGFTIDGNDKECCYFMNFKKGTQKFINCHFVNCKVKNTVSSQGNNGGILNIADVAALELYNTTFGENTLLDDRTAVNICSSKGLTIGGDMTGVTVKFFNNGNDNVINYVEMEGATDAAANVIYATTNLGAEVVKGCTDPSKFNYATSKYELVATGSNLKIARSVYFAGAQTDWINAPIKMNTTDGVFYTLGIEDGITGEWVLNDGSWDWKYAAGDWGVSSWNTKCDMWHSAGKNCDVTSNGVPTYIVFKYNSNESESSKVLVVTRGIHFVGAQTGENGWNTSDPDYQFSTDNGIVYTLNIPDGITGDWKICDGTSDWKWSYGKANGEDAEINLGSVYNLTSNDDNFHRRTKGNTTIIYNMWDNSLRIESLITIGWDNSEHNWETPRVHYSLDGENFIVKEMTKWHAEISEPQSSFRRLRSMEADAWIAEIPENTVAMTFSGDGTNTISQTYDASHIDHMNIYDGNGNVTGVEAVEASEPTDLPVEYYNLQGRRVLNPANGIFIRRQGNKVEKVIM